MKKGPNTEMLQYPDPSSDWNEYIKEGFRILGAYPESTMIKSLLASGQAVAKPEVIRLLQLGHGVIHHWRLL